ncbi:MAG: hypothetical protein P8176_10715 [Gammaproteobacteria bacterium]|jgi:hypothetical protein
MPLTLPHLNEQVVPFFSKEDVVDPRISRKNSGDVFVVLDGFAPNQINL